MVITTLQTEGVFTLKKANIRLTYLTLKGNYFTSLDMKEALDEFDFSKILDELEEFEYLLFEINIFDLEVIFKDSKEL